ncbi:MAG TPA: endonuclease III [Spirochaetota bacterium]|nr:endonuclease III [Spirochaetota bacterium]HOM38781.1 endonuclease III [Spirochaetota bacterium]HPQ49579.1 endonuclease III [Spirochaetota bacterium]
MKVEVFLRALGIIENIINDLSPPIFELDKVRGKDPFRILISTVLSLRTRDQVTMDVSKKLFSLAKTPENILSLGIERIEDIIKPVGFYKNKAKVIIGICIILIERYNSIVPDCIDELLKIDGIGRKTATLVMIEAFNKDYICVDTHVHRISNRLGVVKTKKTYETEKMLMDIVPKEFWKKINKLLVGFGQTLCGPIPKCFKCPIVSICEYNSKRIVF